MELIKLTNQLKALNLPQQQYAVTSSGVLAAHNIREANDFDIVVLPALFEKLKEKYPTITENGIEKIAIGDLEILGPQSFFINSPEIATIEKQIQSSTIINDTPYIKLEYVKKFKEKLGRDKDKKDIELIDKYLSNQ